MKSASAIDPEAMLKKLRKLESNRICPNCGVEATIVGFGNVCIKFRTFVCDLCKTSHQAISHRVKSVTMSTWSYDEVCNIRDGGNSVALKTWLAKAPAYGQRYNGGTRPKSGDKIDVYKKFISDCYDKEMFLGSTEEPQKTVVVSTSAPSKAVSKSTAKPFATVVNPNPEISLLDDFPVSSTNKTDDFGAFCAAPSQEDSFGEFSFAAPDAAHTPAPTSNGFDFDAFQSAPVSSNPTTSFFEADFSTPALTTTAGSQSDPFGVFNMMPSPAAIPPQQPILSTIPPTHYPASMPQAPFANIIQQTFASASGQTGPPRSAYTPSAAAGPFPVIQTTRTEDVMRADAISSMGGMMGPTQGQGMAFGGVLRPTFAPPYGVGPPRPPNMGMGMVPGNSFAPMHHNAAGVYGQPGWNAFGSVSGTPTMQSHRPAW